MLSTYLQGLQPALFPHTAELAESGPSEGLRCMPVLEAPVRHHSLYPLRLL